MGTDTVLPAVCVVLFVLGGFGEVLCLQLWDSEECTTVGSKGSYLGYSGVGRMMWINCDK